MKLVSMVCPQCGGTLQLPVGTKQTQCPFCNTSVMLDDEVQHIQFDNTKQAGYDFEKGRIEAQQEHAVQQAQYNQAAIRAQQEAERKRKNLKWWVLGWIFIFPVPLTILIVKSKKLKPAIKAVLIAALYVVLIAFCIFANNDQKKDAKILWNDTATQLEDFDYYVDGDSIFLKNYKGSDKKVNIASSYEIDGQRLKVTSLDKTFTLERVSSVIVPEGVTSMSDNVFNSSGIQYLYLPSTLTDFDGWHYFHDGEKLYYGGTEDQWKKLFTGDREDLDFKQIVYDAKIEDLLAQNEKE